MYFGREERARGRSKGSNEKEQTKLVLDALPWGSRDTMIQSYNFSRSLSLFWTGLDLSTELSLKKSLPSADISKDMQPERPPSLEGKRIYVEGTKGRYENEEIYTVVRWCDVPCLYCSGTATLLGCPWFGCRCRDASEGKADGCLQAPPPPPPLFP